MPQVQQVSPNTNTSLRRKKYIKESKALDFSILPRTMPLVLDHIPFVHQNPGFLNHKNGQ